VLEYLIVEDKQFNQYLHHLQLEMKLVVELVKEVVVRN
jgi:hypothetical protein